ncbi:hypothetical protein ACVW2L_002175 [Mucilaginibacter sp. HD30]
MANSCVQWLPVDNNIDVAASKNIAIAKKKFSI